MYISVTSTSPLRAYAWNEIVGKFANHVIDDTNPLAPCSVDMHETNTQKKLGCNINHTFSDYRSFDDFTTNIALPDLDKQSFVLKLNKLVGRLMILAQPVIKNHTINKGITASGAACFSFMRVDFAMTRDIAPYIYETNEFPFANEKGHIGSVQERAYTSLFKMIGLDKPPLVASDRSNYELSNLGGWTPLVVDDALVV